MNPHTITETPHVPTPGTRAPALQLHLHGQHSFNSTHTTPYSALPSTVRGFERACLCHHNTAACHPTAKHDNSWAVIPCHPKACLHAPHRPRPSHAPSAPHTQIHTRQEDRREGCSRLPHETRLFRNPLQLLLMQPCEYCMFTVYCSFGFEVVVAVHIAV